MTQLDRDNARAIQCIRDTERCVVCGGTLTAGPFYIYDGDVFCRDHPTPGFMRPGHRRED